MSEVPLSPQLPALRPLLAGLSVGVLVQDHAGRIVHGNPEAGRILGLTIDQLCGRASADPCWRAIREDGGQVAGEEHPAMVALRTGRAVRDAVLGVRRPGGEPIWIAVDAEPLASPDDGPRLVVSTLRDVTEARRTHLAVQAERERLSVTLRSIGDAVIATDDQSRVTVLNEAAEVLTGWPQAEAIGRPLGEIFRIINEETRGICEDPVSRVLREGAVVGLANHTLLVARDGTERPIADSGAPIRGTDGRITGVVLVFRDQTEERRAERELRASEQRLRLALEAAQAGTWEWDLRTNRNVWSEGLWSLYGLERNGREPSYDTWRDSIHPDDRQRVEEAVGTAARTGSDLSVEWRVHAPGAAERWLASRGRPLGDERGALDRYLGIVVDASSQKRADRALRESEARLRAIFDQAAVGVVRADATGRLLEANGRFCDLLGYSRAQLLAMTFRDFTHPDDVAADVAGLRRALASGSPHRREKRYLRADGTVVWANISVNRIAVPGEAAASVVTIVEDITQRKAAESALRESEERYRALVEQAADALYLHDFDGRFRDVNQRACADLGYTREELLRMRVPDVDPNFDLASARREWARLQRGLPLTLVSANRRKDGSTFPVEVRFALLTVGGEPLIMGHSRDITDRVRAEDALRRSEYRYRAIFDQAAVGVVEADSSTGRFLEVNDRLCEMTRYSRNELLGLRWQDLAPADEGELARLAAAETASLRERRFVRKDGADLWCALRVNRLAIPGAPSTTHIAFVSDITARKAADERYRAFTERSSDLTLVLDAARRIAFVSPSSRQILGFDPQEMVGRPDRDFLHPDDLGLADASFAAMIADPVRAKPYDVRMRRRVGGWTLLEAVGRNLVDVPAVAGIVLNHRDITERNRFRDQLLQSQKLESVGRLAGGVAHDFNNLLTVILGCSESVLARPGTLPGETLEDVDEIRAAGERARDLTGQLLAFARKQVISPVVVDLNSLVRSQQKMLGRLLGEDIELEVRLQHLAWTTFADRSQLEQVLLNLAVNARDAMPRGGKLTIETLNRTVEEHDQAEFPGLHAGQWVQLRVSDTGVGMSEEVKAHLFEPFFTTKEQGKGTGLGLATIYGIVAQAGGHVHVESAPGRGATFQVCLPRVEPPAAVQPPTAAPRTAEGTEGVLVVEDDAMVRNVVVRVLSGQGYRVRALGHPRQALALPAEDLQGFPLLLTDVVMPEIDGHALAQELARRRPGLRVLYLSGYTRDAISERGVIDSGLNFLAKPFSRSSLLAKVREVLDAR